MPGVDIDPEKECRCPYTGGKVGVGYCPPCFGNPQACCKEGKKVACSWCYKYSRMKGEHNKKIAAHNSAKLFVDKESRRYRLTRNVVSCHFCSTTLKPLVVWDTKGGRGVWYVRCPACGARGPTKPLRGSAVYAWNNGGRV